MEPAVGVPAHHDGGGAGRLQRPHLRADGDGVVEVEVEHDDVERVVGVVDKVMPARLGRHDRHARGPVGEARLEAVEHETVVVDDRDSYRRRAGAACCGQLHGNPLGVRADCAAPTSLSDPLGIQ
jgi:hypothetical protein